MENKNKTRELTTLELCEINGGGPLGRLIGWILGIMNESAMNELEVHGYIDYTRP